MRILLTPSARTQFLEAIEYVHKENPVAAAKMRQKAERVLRRLIRFPDSGRLIPEFPELPFREVQVPPYRFFYRKEGSVIWVVGVWHGAQIPETPDA